MDAGTENRAVQLDALLPPEMAVQAEQIGAKKAGMGALNVFLLAILGGGFIAMGGIFTTTVLAGAGTIPYGIARLLGGIAFATGLIMVVVGGAELFTGNVLIVIAFASRRIRLRALLRNWALVYAGNFVGAVGTAYLMYVAQHYRFGHGAVGLAMLATGETKTGLAFLPAVVLGIFANALVCMAVWMCYGARTTTGRVLAIVPPIAAFVAAGFEHSVANMYLIPVALFVKDGADPQFFNLIHKTAADFPQLTWTNFLVANLVPTTLGNIIGGAGFVGVMYWFVYLRRRAN